MLNTKPYKTAQEKLDEYIRNNNLRPSKVRNLVLENICQLEQPFVAEQLVHVCQSERISVGTVYNVLNLLILAQILHATKRQRGKTATEYEIITGNSTRMQMICTKCGRKADIHDKAVERLLKERKYSNFTMQHFTLFVYGECKICRNKTKK